MICSYSKLVKKLEEQLKYPFIPIGANSKVFKLLPKQEKFPPIIFGQYSKLVNSLLLQ